MRTSQPASRPMVSVRWSGRRERTPARSHSSHKPEALPGPAAAPGRTIPALHYSRTSARERDGAERSAFATSLAAAVALEQCRLANNWLTSVDHGWSTCIPPVVASLPFQPPTSTTPPSFSATTAGQSRRAHTRAPMGRSGRYGRFDSSRTDCPSHAVRDSTSVRHASAPLARSRWVAGMASRKLNSCRACDQAKIHGRNGPRDSISTLVNVAIYVAIYVAISVPNRAGTCRSVPLGLEQTGCFTRESGAPGGIRTPDHLIRSQMLYPLSYGRAATSRGSGQHLSRFARNAGRNRRTRPDAADWQATSPRSQHGGPGGHGRCGMQLVLARRDDRRTEQPRSGARIAEGRASGRQFPAERNWESTFG